MKSQEIFDLGYAVPLYDISTYTRTWRFRDEEFKLPFGSVWPSIELPGLSFKVAKIEDVRRAVEA